MDQWLIRTAQNLIAGPYTAEQIRQLIQDNQLSHQDEICPANGYWIYLHERDELKRLLGTELPRQKPVADEDSTETGAQTDPSLVESTASIQPPADARLRNDTDVPELPDEANRPLDRNEQTAMLHNSALKRFQPRKEQDQNPGPIVSVDGNGDRPRSESAPTGGPPDRRLAVRLQFAWNRFDRATGGKGPLWLLAGALAIALFLAIRFAG